MAKPFPSELVQHLTLRDGTHVIVRPIRPEDRQMEGIVMAGNNKMLGLMNALGFSVRSDPGDASVKHVTKQLGAAPSASARTSDSVASDVN